MPCDHGLIVFHIESPGNCRRAHFSKTRGVYEEYEKYWGNVIIFPRDERTDDRYAHLLSPDGTKVHHLSVDTFRRLNSIPGVSHIYQRLNPRDFKETLENVKRMSWNQLQELKDKIRWVERYHR